MSDGTATGAAPALDPVAAAGTLLAWLSTGFPVGAFAWSHGLEAAVAAGEAADRDGFRDWLAAVVAQGAGRSDAVLLAAAWRDPAAAGPAELAAALQPSAERRAESLTQGAAFARVAGEAWGVAFPPAAYPVAVGRAARAAGVPLEMAAALYVQAFAANLVAAALRLFPLGETAGQGVLAELAPLIRETAAQAVAADPEDLGGACLGADLASMRHESLQPRLFRS